MKTDANMYLLPVPVLGYVAGRQCALTEYAIVAPVAGDPENAARILARVVEPRDTGLRQDATLAVDIIDLLSLAEAQELLESRRADRATG